jgi:hypothetical protein
MGGVGEEGGGGGRDRKALRDRCQNSRFRFEEWA